MAIGQIVDNMELRNEREEWRMVCDMLRTKPVLKRIPEEESRLLTLASSLRPLHRDRMPVEARLAVIRALEFEHVAQKGKEIINPHEMQGYLGPWRIILSGTVEMRVASGHGRATHDLTKGDSIGDSLTLKSLPKGSAFVTKEACDFLVLKRDDYEKMIGSVPAVVGYGEERELDSRVSFFGEGLVVPLFASWGPYQLRELAKKAYPRKYPSRTVIVREREEGQDLFFIRSGECRVVREIEFTQHKGIQQRRTVKLLELALLTQGEYFGELAFLGHSIPDRPPDSSRHRGDAAAKRGAGRGRAPRPPTDAAGRAKGGRRGEPARMQSMRAHERGGQASGGPDGMSYDSDDSDDCTLDDEMGTQTTATGKGTRQATVFSHTPLELLVVPAEAAKELITGNPYQRMREYAKGYPTAAEIRQHFTAQQDWASFKTALVADIVSADKGPW